MAIWLNSYAPFSSSAARRSLFSGSGPASCISRAAISASRRWTCVIGTCHLFSPAGVKLRQSTCSRPNAHPRWQWLPPCAWIVMRVKNWRVDRRGFVPCFLIIVTGNSIFKTDQKPYLLQLSCDHFQNKRRRTQRPKNARSGDEKPPRLQQQYMINRTRVTSAEIHLHILKGKRVLRAPATSPQSRQCRIEPFSP